MTIRPDAIDTEYWPSPEYAPVDAVYTGVSYPLPTPPRRASDGESTATARKDPRYQATPGSDKRYHCPFENEGCTHAPEKLKCNYE